MVQFRSRQLLSLAAWILPSVAIVILGWSIFNKTPVSSTLQKRQIWAVRWAVWGKLESIKLGEIGAPETWPRRFADPAVVLVASVTPNGLVLPWESGLGSDLEATPASVLNLGTRLKEQFTHLNLKQDAWISYPGDEEVLLSLTPKTGDTGQQRVIAVRGKDIFERVRSERDDNADGKASDFTIETASDFRSQDKDTLLSPTSLSPTSLLDKDKFPGLLITFSPGGDPGIQAVYLPYQGTAIVLVISLTLLSGYLLKRDTDHKLRVAEMRSDFVSNVSHELKTPLTAIRMFAETLQLRGSTNPQIRKEYLDTIINESERLSRLLNNVLDFSSIERGQKQYHRVSTSLADVVQSAAQTMQFQLTEQNFSLRVDICDGIPPMRLDHDALKQAIINLLNNAMKFSGKSREITLRLISDNGNALIQVADRGFGIAPEEKKRIFDKFYRIATPENRAIPGTGLGLALIAHVAEAHGWMVDVESALGIGSTFSIRIPVHGNGHS